MPGRECYHCKQWIEEGEAHDCWTTTPENLTRDLPEDLREAWERLHETAAAFGEQRIYASHNSIMFSRRACYFFVRPRPSRLEVYIFLGRTLRSPQVRRADQVSRVKVAHLVHVRHRDEVEAPLTDWLEEAYRVSDSLRGAAAKRPRGAAGARTAAGTKPAKRARAAPKKSAGAKPAKSPGRTAKASRTPARSKRRAR